MTKVISPKKLIEVALPLDDINAAAAREKSIRHGHPSTLHLWWARRPLAAARAVLFAQMVNDPSGTVQGDKRLRETQLKITNEREKLFDIIRELVKWENTNNEEVLNKAREAIKESWRFTCELNKKHPQAEELFNPEKLPAFHDPFSGGGAIPLEAQRLGLESYASDLNPVAVMINKAMIEIPPKFAGQAPVGPIPESDKTSKKKSTQDMLADWSGAKGLAEDVRRYGHWMREQAFERIGHLYPKVTITDEMAKDREDLKHYVGEELVAMAYVWARTVKNPSPAFSHIETPIVKSYWLSKKKGKEAFVDVEECNGNHIFKVKSSGEPKLEQGLSRKGAVCPISGDSISLSYIRDEAIAGRLGNKLMAVILEHKKGRIYVSPDETLEQIARIELDRSNPPPTAKIDHWGGCTNCVVYGMDTFDKLFSAR